MSMTRNEVMEKAAAQCEKCLWCKRRKVDKAGEGDCHSNGSQVCSYRGDTVAWPDVYIYFDCLFEAGDRETWRLPGVQRSLTLTCVGYERGSGQ